MNRRGNGSESRRRSSVISVLSVFSLLLLALAIFAVANQARNLSSDVEQAVRTGETLRVVSIARAELSVASRIAVTSPDQVLVIEGAIANAKGALNEVAQNIDSSTSDVVVDAFAEFERAADAQVDQLTESPENLEASQQAELATGEAFTALAEELRAEQVSRIDGLETGNDLMNLTVAIATFVVAFVVPSMGILIFQALRNAPREQRRLAYEHDRLKEQHRAMAKMISEEAAELRTQIANDNTESKIGSHSELKQQKSNNSAVRAWLRFESLATATGAPTSIETETLAINDLVSKAVDRIDSNRIVEVDSRGELSAVGDRQHLEVVIAELVSNAITHGAAPIRTRVRAEGANVELHVIDSGEGLSEELVTALIDERDFDLRTSASVGTYGFGLIAARRSLEAMGGTLRYQRNRGRTHLIASLPLAEAGEHRTAA